MFSNKCVQPEYLMSLFKNTVIWWRCTEHRVSLSKVPYKDTRTLKCSSENYFNKNNKINFSQSHVSKRVFNFLCNP